MEKNRIRPVTSGKSMRMSYSRQKEVLQMPNLIEVQKDSYQWFLDEGLKEAFADISPITDYSGKLSLDFVDFTLCEDDVKYTIPECKERDATYAAPLKVKVRLHNKETDEINEHEIFMGDLPLMTETGTFVINGAERVIVSQLVRSPGIYYGIAHDKLGKTLYSCTVIPNRGAWLEYETDSNDVFYVRVDDTAVHKAVREAAVNMIIHADYHSTGVLKVIKYDDGFLFSNPGNLKLPVQAIYEGGHSVARNPKIQNMFRMIGLGDNIGSGFPTILNVWGEENWRKPDLYDDQELHQVELRLWMVSLMPVECTEYLHKIFGQDYQYLQAEEQIILSTAYLEEKVSNTRLQSVLNLTSIEVGRLLTGLVEKKMLIVENRGRWTTYYINTKYESVPRQLEMNDIFTVTVKLNRTDQLIYQYVKANGMITTQQVVDIVDAISTTQGALVAISRLMKKNLLKKNRQGKHIFYTLK